MRRTTLVRAAIPVVGGLLVLGVGLTVDSLDHRNASAAAAAVRADNEFWQEVAGAGAPDSSASSGLAASLRQTLQTPDGPAAFEGLNSQYGGVDSELGFHPFLDDPCEDCGHLTPTVLRDLGLVRAGHVDRVLTVPPAATGLPAAVPVGAAAGTTAVLVAGVFGPEVLARRRRYARLEAAYPDIMVSLRQVGHEIASLPHDERAPLEARRDATLAELTRGLRTPEPADHIERRIADGRLTDLQEQVTERLRALDELEAPDTA